MAAEDFGLPRPLGDGLVLRWAESGDAEELAEFNFRMHNDAPEDRPETWLRDWTCELMDGRHPTTGPADFTVVTSEEDGGKIVSASVLISQVWAYDGIPFGVGRPELIATEPEWRRRGLIRHQMDVLHERSLWKGEQVQAITGIPWFYRQFGYEMALEHWGSRDLLFSSVAALEEGKKEAFRLRPAASEDLPALQELYDIHCRPSLISCVRDDAIWKFELEADAESNVNRRNLHLIEKKDGEITGYVEFPDLKDRWLIRELAFYPGFSMRQAALFVARHFKAKRDASTAEPSTKRDQLRFALGSSHPAYEALGSDLSPLHRPYAWYIRVPDLAGFLEHIRVALERRLAESPLAGFSGSLKLNLYQQQIEMVFVNGKLESVKPYTPESFFDGDAFFPGLTFLQLLFGFRSLDELKSAFTDCGAFESEASILVESLFPKHHSQVIPFA